jgi:hypothetical protein
MKIALFSDIHANLPAFEAMLQDIFDCNKHKKGHIIDTALVSIKFYMTTICLQCLHGNQQGHL